MVGQQPTCAGEEHLHIERGCGSSAALDQATGAAVAAVVVPSGGSNCFGHRERRLYGLKSVTATPSDNDIVG